MIELFENQFFNIISTIFFYFVFFIFIFYIVDLLKILPTIKKLLIYIKRYIFIVFLIPAFGFLMIDFFSPTFKSLPNYVILKDMCTILFSAGVFTTALNFLDSLDVFKKNFKEIIMSKEFDDILTKKIDALAYSEDHLNKQNNIEHIWQTVTLCKYKKEFPELYEKLRNKIENLLFKKNNISYYYKNFQISYFFDLLDDKYILITERTSFTIVRPHKDEFEFDFVSGYNNKDPESYAKSQFFSKNINEIKFSETDLTLEVGDEFNTLTCSKKMKGHLEYHIESIIERKQNLDDDRIFSYGSARIIDDLTINLDYSDKINVTFVSLNGNKFYPNGSNVANRMSYINRDVLLSGEKFILFFHRPNV